MQLVDAIRQAAKNPTPVTDPSLTSAAVIPQPPTSAATAGSAALHVAPPAAPNKEVFGGSIVRLELFLDPEQLSILLSGIVRGAHSVLTLREAAKYVRITAGDLEQLCESHQVPAFKLEGKWRFPKAALDDWLAARSMADLTNEQEYEEGPDGP
jgi:excisionase family DNA binding protein